MVEQPVGVGGDVHEAAMTGPTLKHRPANSTFGSFGKQLGDRKYNRRRLKIVRMVAKKKPKGKVP